MGRLKFNSKNAVDVLVAVDYFSMVNILQTCADFVVAHAMVVDNEIKLYTFFVRSRLNAHAINALNFIKVFFLLFKKINFKIALSNIFGAQCTPYKYN